MIKSIYNKLAKIFTKIYIYFKIKSWQKRQNSEITQKQTSSIKPTFNTIYKIAETLYNIEYIEDKKQYKKNDHWPTYKQVVLTRKDDCDGQAIYKFMECYYNNIDKEHLYLTVIRGHMFLSIYDSTINDYWVLDNGYITRKIEPLSNLKLDVYAMFNLKDIKFNVKK
jgi:predicted transglutaminase-like cysteine proteinase